MIVPTLRQALASSPVVMYFFAFLAGLVMFFVFRGVLRNLPVLIHLILGVLVGVGVYYLLRAWIY
jgi:predicted transporter